MTTPSTAATPFTMPARDQGLRDLLNRQRRDRAAVARAAALPEWERIREEWRAEYRANQEEAEQFRAAARAEQARAEQARAEADRAAAKPACPECVEIRRRSVESVKNPTVTADGFARYLLAGEVSPKLQPPTHELNPMEARLWALLRRGEAKAEAEAAKGPQPKVTTYCEREAGVTLPRTPAEFAAATKGGR